MKQKEVFKKIGDIIIELSDQYEYLKTVPDDLNELELELFVSNAHFLTDHIEILCKLNLQNSKIKKPPVEKPEITYEQKYFEPVVQQMKQAAGINEEKPKTPFFKPVEAEVGNSDKQDETPESAEVADQAAPVDTHSILVEEPEVIRHELVLDETQDRDDDENIAAENEVAKSDKKRKAGTPEPIEALNGSVEAPELKPAENKEEPAKVDKTKEEEILTINQKISSQLGDKGIARTEQLSVKPISDIKLAITLNDKLLYVKDLFNGYNLAYSEAIEILNRFNTFEEAMRFLKTNYISKNNWESKPATTEKFYALLKRRYA